MPGVEPQRLLYISQLAEPGHYATEVCKLQTCPEGCSDIGWFVNRLVEGDLLATPIDPATSAAHKGVGRCWKVSSVDVASGESLPPALSSDFGFHAVVVGGTFHSVHEHRPWQQQLRIWLEKLWQREPSIPLLGICGGHQLLAHMRGGAVEKRAAGHNFGTLPVHLTTAGERHPLFEPSVVDWRFHFANGEHVTRVANAQILATTSDSFAVALDYGKGWCSVQFHPEADAGTFRPLFDEPERFCSPGEVPLMLIRNFLASAGMQHGTSLAEGGRWLFFTAVSAKGADLAK